MEILLNKRKETIEMDELSMQQLIEHKNFTFKLLVTKINGKLVKKEMRTDTFIKDGDEVLVLHMISGG